jgi:hypothetical protein
MLANASVSPVHLQRLNVSLREHAHSPTMRRQIADLRLADLRLDKKAPAYRPYNLFF